MKYRSDQERLLTTMMNCAQGDEAHIPRFLVKLRVGPWLRAAEFDKMLDDLTITRHQKPGPWKGEYYLLQEIADKLYAIRRVLDDAERQHIRTALAAALSADDDTGW